MKTSKSALESTSTGVWCVIGMHDPYGADQGAGSLVIAPIAMEVNDYTGQPVNKDNPYFEMDARALVFNTPFDVATTKYRKDWPSLIPIKPVTDTPEVWSN